MFANRLLTAAVNTNACATVSPKNRTRNHPTSFQHQPTNKPTEKPWILVFNAKIRLYVNATIWFQTIASMWELSGSWMMTGTFNFPSFALEIYFLIIWAASFFLSFSLSFFLFFLLFSLSLDIPQDTFWQSGRSRVQNNFCHLCNTTCKINKLSYIYLTACCFGHYSSCYPCFLAI